MAYYVYRIGPVGVLEKLAEHGGFAEASKAAKALRASPDNAGYRVKVIFAENELQAEDLINTQRAFERTGEDE